MITTAREFGRSKKLFVRKGFRGPHGASHALYDKTVAPAQEHRLAVILLDTSSIPKRSRAFYGRKGYALVDRDDLPADYDFPDRNSLIFKLNLAQGD